MLLKYIALITLAFSMWILPVSATGGIISATNDPKQEEQPGFDLTPAPDEIPMPPLGQFYTLPIMIDCGNYQSALEIVLKAGEQPFSTGTVLFKIPDGRAIQATLETWINPKTRTFTSIIRITKDYACLVFPGQHFRDAPRGVNL